MYVETYERQVNELCFSNMDFIAMFITPVCILYLQQITISNSSSTFYVISGTNQWVNRDIQLYFIVSFFDTGHPCYGHVIISQAQVQLNTVRIIFPRYVVLPAI